MNSTDARRLRNWLVVGASIATLVAVVVCYPYLLGLATERFGERSVALTLLVLVGSAGLVRRTAARALRYGGAPASVVPLLLLASVASGEAVFLRLVPTAVFASLADMCRISLRDGVSIIERAVQYMVPEAPGFIREYCRNLTWLWCGFFVASSAVSGWLAICGDLDHWNRFTGSGIYAAMALITAIEFFVRKTWFRYYFHEGPFDRFWSRLFPAEDTLRGRQSIVYIRQFRDRANQQQP